MSTAVDQLLEVLGCAVSREQAARLLADADGDVATAVTAHFSGNVEPPPAQSQSPEAQKISTLRSVLGDGIPQAQLEDLLRRAGGSVEAAVGLHLDGPPGDGPNQAGAHPGQHGGGGSRGGGGGGSGGGSAARGRGRAMRVADDDQEEGPVRRSNRGARSAAAAGGSGAAGTALAAGTRGVTAAGGGGSGAGGSGQGGSGTSAAVASGGAEPVGRRDDPAGPGSSAPSMGRAAAGNSTAAGPSALRQPPLGSARSIPVRDRGDGDRASALPAATAATSAAPAPAPVPAAATVPAAVGVPAAAAATATERVVGPSAVASGQGPERASVLPPRPAAPAAQQQRARRTSQEANRALRPLMDGDMLFSVKRSQGPCPVRPRLPLPQYRRPDGSLFVQDDSTTQGIKQWSEPLAGFRWPMLLGSASEPLRLEARQPYLYPNMPTGVPEKLLQMALEWFQEGKVKLGGVEELGPSEGLFWKGEIAGAGVWSRPMRYRLSLWVRHRAFMRAAIAAFPEVEEFKTRGGRHGFLEDRPLLLAVTVVGGPMERLAKFVLDNNNACLGKAPNPDVGFNVRIFGPGLDPAEGLVLKLDVSGEQAASSADCSDSDSDGDGAPGGRAGTAAKKRKVCAARVVRSAPGVKAVQLVATEEVGDAAKPAGRKRARPAAAADQETSPGKGKSNRDGRGASKGKGAEARSPQRLAKKAKNGSGVAAGKTGSAGATGGGPSQPAKKLKPQQSAGGEGYRLDIEFFLLEETLEATLPSSKAAARKKPVRELLATVIHTVLEHGNGLYVGPDCDGAINTGDAAPSEGAPGGAAGTSSGAGPSSGAAVRRPRRAASAGPADSGGAAGTSTGGAASSGGGSDAEGDGEDTEEVRNLDELLDSIQPPADLPQAIPPPAVVAQPKPFQLQGLEWMLRRERRGDAVGRSLLLLHPAWAQVVVGSSGLVLHIQRMAPFFVTADFKRAPVGGTCGGFLCDEMGLGKSLQTLMLVASNPPPEGWAAKPQPVVLNLAGEPVSRKAGGGVRGGPAAGRGAEGSPGVGPVPMTALVEPEDDEPVAIATTLLVTPANLQEQWVEEIKRHLRPGAVKWAIFEGYKKGTSGAVASTSLAQARLGSVETSGAAGDNNDEAGGAGPLRRPVRSVRLQSSLQAQDSRAVEGQRKLLPPVLAKDENGELVPIHDCQLVLCSYEVLRRDLAIIGSGRNGRDRLLPRLGFWRIVLDEAQLVANNNSVAAGVVSSLYRRHAWVVTGTPISSSINEVQGLCEFLDCQPFYEGQVWRQLVLEPYVQRSTAGIAAFRALLRGVMLRRSKAAVEDQLALPPCTREDVEVVLSGVERAYYDVLKGRFNHALNSLRNANEAEEASRRRGHGARHIGLDDSRRPVSAQYRSAALLLDLRQCCCHPHIVRREAEGAAGQPRGAKGDQAQAAGPGAGAGADGRRSMRQIMANLVADAYSAYDAAVGGLFGARVLKAALADYNNTPGNDPGPGTSAGGGSAGAASTGGPSNSALLETLEAIRTMTMLVAETDILRQARARRPDGTIDPDKAKAAAAFGGGPGAMGGMAPLVAAEQARDRRRRWQRLQLDCLMLRCYIACMHAPPGTLQLLASQARARAMAEARDQANAKIGHAEEAAQYRTAAHAAARDDTEEARRIHEAAAAAAPGGSKPSGGDAKAAEETEEEAELRRATNREAAAKRAKDEAHEAEKRARAAAEVAEQMAAVAAAEAAEATAEAAVEVADAAARIYSINVDVNELRVVLGMDPVDFGLAETELRRSRRQQEAGGGAEAGPSGFATAAGAAAAAAAAAEAAAQGGGDSSDSDYQEGDDDSDDGGRCRRRGKKRSGKELVGVRGRRQRRSEDGAGGVEGLLIALGGTPYQEALFRAETAIKNFQQQTGRRHASAKVADAAHTGEEARLLQVAREKWHGLQHLMNQQKDLGLADDLPPPAAGQAEGAPAAASGSAAAAGADVNAGSGSSAAANGAGGSAVALAAPLANGLGQGGGGGAANGGTTEREEASCPICFEALNRRTVTKCGHSFCPDCIHDIVQGQGTAPCPICRRQLSRDDLFDSVSEEEEARMDALVAAEALADGGNAEYGAKVSALLVELGRMTEADPCSKALVFSSWGRLLRLVKEGLAANGIRCAALLGGNPELRQKALHDFLHDPGCRVLLLIKSTSGGAAGLTLTVAHTAFIMEPAVNPGLEAQAAARICRLGQDRPTRVIRFIAKDTVEERVLALQQHKQLHGDKAAVAEVGSEGVDRSLMLRFFDRL